ncbi:MAG: ABC transporter permease [Coriobacteriia bacterium]|nr:ABC transporter permease [Coriobacteriia bacterium]
MSWTLLRGTFTQRRTSILWYSVSLIAYSWLMTWFYPQIGGGQYADLIENMPPEMLALFGGTEVDFATLGGYFQTEYLGLMWMLITASALIIFAGKAFSGEIGAGTMEFVLAQPVSRVRFAITRVAALLLYIVVLAAVSFVPIALFGPSYDINLSAAIFWELFAFGCMFMLAVGGFALFVSSLFRDSGRAGAITAGVMGMFWIADLVSNVSEAAEVIDPINIVTYWQPGKIINGDAVAPEAWWIYGVIGVVSLVASVVVFRRRDVA